LAAPAVTPILGEAIEGEGGDGAFEMRGGGDAPGAVGRIEQKVRLQELQTRARDRPYQAT